MRELGGGADEEGGPTADHPLHGRHVHPAGHLGGEKGQVDKDKKKQATLGQLVALKRKPHKKYFNNFERVMKKGTGIILSSDFYRQVYKIIGSRKSCKWQNFKVFCTAVQKSTAVNTGF